MIVSERSDHSFLLLVDWILAHLAIIHKNANELGLGQGNCGSKLVVVVLLMLYSGGFGVVEMDCGR